MQSLDLRWRSGSGRAGETVRDTHLGPGQRTVQQRRRPYCIRRRRLQRQQQQRQPQRLRSRARTRRRRRRQQRVEACDEVDLRARLGAVRVARALLDARPLARDDRERRAAVARRTALDEPAPDNGPRPSNAAAAVHGGDPPARRAVAQRGEDGGEQRRVRGQPAVGDREPVVLDLRRLDGEQRRALEKDGVVRKQLAWLREVDEGAHARAQERVELGLVRARWAPWVLACEEIGCCPVGIGYWAWAARRGEGVKRGELSLWRNLRSV